ncbi:MAG: hypothetical protein WCF26_27725 [Candidatus Sulfotelmatobacter sp.]
MREFVISVAVGVAIGLAWMVVWAFVLRAFGIPTLARTPEERATRKERILQMGKLRYILIFGVLGSGVAYGLGIGIALMTSRHRYDWGLGATIFGAVALVTGCMNGIRTWNERFRVEVPFPPHYPPSK